MRKRIAAKSLAWSAAMVFSGSVAAAIVPEHVSFDSLDRDPSPTTVNDCGMIGDVTGHRQHGGFEGVWTVAENAHVEESVVHDRARQQLKASRSVAISADIDVDHLAHVQDPSVDHDATAMRRVTIQSVECGLQQARSSHTIQ